MAIAFGTDEVNALVFDIGSRSARIGYAGADTPAFDLACLAGLIQPTEGEKEKPPLFGDVFLKVKRPNVDIHTFIRDGVVSNWRLYEHMLDYIYSNLLRTQSDQHPVLFSEHPTNPRESREHLCELMFEKYQVPAFQIIKSPVLSIFSQGKYNGLVLEIGHDFAVASPILDAYVIQRAVVQSPLAGCFLLRQYQRVLNLPSESPAFRAPENTTSSYKDYLAMMTMMDLGASTFQAYDSTPYDAGILEQMPRITYELPDRSVLDLGEERYRVPEALFDTRRVPGAGTDLGLAHLVAASIGLCDVDARASLYSNVLVVGGVSQMPGLVDRLNHELLQKVPSNMKLKIVSPASSNEKRFSAFIGGSIVASMSTFHNRWISKHEFAEHGKSVVDKKCP